MTLPDAFAVDYEEVQEKYKFITAATLLYSAEDSAISYTLFPNDYQLFVNGICSNNLLINKGFQLNSNPRLNKFQYGLLVFFFEKLVFFEFFETETPS